MGGNWLVVVEMDSIGWSSICSVKVWNMLMKEEGKVGKPSGGERRIYRLQAGAKDQPESHCQRSVLGRNCKCYLILGQQSDHFKVLLS